MLSEEEIEKNRIPEQLAKALGIEKEDSDSLIAFKESIFEETVRENIKLKKQIEQLESDKQDLIEKLEEILEKYEHEIASEESAINLYTEIKEIAKGEKE